MIIRIKIARIVAHSSLYLNQLAKNRSCTYPTVDAPAVVANLKPVPLDSLHKMQVLGTVHLAQDDISGTQVFGLHRLHRAQLPWLDPWCH
jgi:hypothetical protein